MVKRQATRPPDDRADTTANESAAKAVERRQEHVSASGDDETPDGLNELDEETRRGAEDIPAAERARRDVPVFDRSTRSRDE